MFVFNLIFRYKGSIFYVIRKKVYVFMPNLNGKQVPFCELIRNKIILGTKEEYDMIKKVCPKPREAIQFYGEKFRHGIVFFQKPIDEEEK